MPMSNCPYGKNTFQKGASLIESKTFWYHIYENLPRHKMIIKSPHYTFENWCHIFLMNIKVRALRSCSLISSWLAISSVRVSGALVCDGMLIGHAQKKIWCQKHAINSQSPKEKRHPLESTIHHTPPKTAAGLYLECWLKFLLCASSTTSVDLFLDQRI